MKMLVTAMGDIRTALLAIVSCACCMLVSPAHAGQPPVTECDRLAASPDDLQRAPGVTGFLAITQINTEAAFRACEDAVRQYPDAPRFKYQLARVTIARSGGCARVLSLLETAVHQGHGEAAALLGKCFGMGWGIPLDRNETVKWNREGAALGSLTAQATVAIYIGSGTYGYRKDRAKALQLLWQLAELDNTYALFRLADQYRHGFWVKKDHDCSFELLLRAAERGDPTSQRMIADEYLVGRLGTPRDVKKAFEFMTRAAEGGAPDAKTKLPEIEKLLAPEQKTRLPNGKPANRDPQTAFDHGRRKCHGRLL